MKREEFAASVALMLADNEPSVRYGLLLALADVVADRRAAIQRYEMSVALDNELSEPVTEVYLVKEWGSWRVALNREATAEASVMYIKIRWQRHDYQFATIVQL